MGVMAGENTRFIFKAEKSNPWRGIQNTRLFDDGSF
jgi:hypothetical protein